MIRTNCCLWGKRFSAEMQGIGQSGRESRGWSLCEMKLKSTSMMISRGTESPHAREDSPSQRKFSPVVFTFTIELKPKEAKNEVSDM